MANQTASTNPFHDSYVEPASPLSVSGQPSVPCGPNLAGLPGTGGLIQPSGQGNQAPPVQVPPQQASGRPPVPCGPNHAGSQGTGGPIQPNNQVARAQPARVNWDVVQWSNPPDFISSRDSVQRYWDRAIGQKVRNCGVLRVEKASEVNSAYAGTNTLYLQFANPEAAEEAVNLTRQFEDGGVVENCEMVSDPEAAVFYKHVVMSERNGREMREMKEYFQSQMAQLTEQFNELNDSHEALRSKAREAEQEKQHRLVEGQIFTRQLDEAELRAQSLKQKYNTVTATLKQSQENHFTEVRKHEVQQEKMIMQMEAMQRQIEAMALQLSAKPKPNPAQTQGQSQGSEDPPLITFSPSPVPPPVPPRPRLEDVRTDSGSSAGAWGQPPVPCGPNHAGLHGTGGLTQPSGQGRLPHPQESNSTGLWGQEGRPTAAHSNPFWPPPSQGSGPSRPVNPTDWQRGVPPPLGDVPDLTGPSKGVPAHGPGTVKGESLVSRKDEPLKLCLAGRLCGVRVPRTAG